MSWDLKLDPGTRDLVPGVARGADEALQRLVTRLNRELGEWFLNTKAGLPWFRKGEGLLGSKDKRLLELLVRKETLGTQGVSRIVRLNTMFTPGHRDFALYMLLVIDDRLMELTLTSGGASWRTA